MARKMMRLVALFLALTLSLCACARKAPEAGEVADTVTENRDLLLACVAEMEALGQDRVYVAMEAKKAEEGQTLSQEDKLPRLVSYPKESDDREEIENPTLQRAIESLSLALIFFQTAADGRRCVIFSYTKENASGIQNGFYYSYDALPCAWWGRRAQLIRQNDRHIQLSRDGKGAYYTLPITESFFYFEKYGPLGQ